MTRHAYSVLAAAHVPHVHSKWDIAIIAAYVVLFAIVLFDEVRRERRA